mgnify:CR=1 FL=1
MDARTPNRLPFHRLPVFPVLLAQLAVILLAAAALFMTGAMQAQMLSAARLVMAFIFFLRCSFPQTEPPQSIAGAALSLCCFAIMGRKY